MPCLITPVRTPDQEESASQIISAVIDPESLSIDQDDHIKYRESPRAYFKQLATTDTVPVVEQDTSSNLFQPPTTVNIEQKFVLSRNTLKTIRKYQASSHH